MTLIDSHSHIDDRKFSDDIESVIDRAQEAGLTYIIAVGVDIASSEKCIRLAERYPMVYATAGIHPHDAGKAPSNYLLEIQQLSTHDKVVAIGEIGLDYHYNFSDPPIQIRRFREQLEFAQSIHFPVIIHNRESDDDLILNISESKCRTGVLHSFSGSLSLAQKAVEMDLHLGFSGMVTFLKSPLTDVVTWAPSDKYLIETDAPYLAPVPHRGKRNEPAFVSQVAAKIADLRGTSTEEIAEQSSQNTLQLFSRISH